MTPTSAIFSQFPHPRLTSPAPSPPAKRRSLSTFHSLFPLSITTHDHRCNDFPFSPQPKSTSSNLLSSTMASPTSPKPSPAPLAPIISNSASTPSLVSPENQAILTDSELYAKCKKWGAEALEARRKFIGLLPEVFKRRLYERRNFTSIYHFAAELGGVSERLVNEVLRLEKRFEEMPVLHSALVSGEIGLSKLTRVASVVEVKNEAVICEKIRTLSRRAVDVLVKEMGGANNEPTNQDGLFSTMNNEISSSGQTRSETISAEEQVNKPATSQNISSNKNHDFEILAALSPEVKAKLKELINQEIDINALISQALEKRKAEITERKATIGETAAKSRYIPVKIKQILKEEFGSKCSYKNCLRPAEQIHHEKSYAIYQDHNPRDLKPLCRGHHELSHVT